MRLHRVGWLRPLFLLAWRIRERETGLAPETTGAPGYKRGKVTGLVPDLVVITETGESPWVCCGYCAAAMASWTATKGIGHSLGSTAHPIRSAGGRPHDNGSRASELRDGARGAHGVTLEALAVDEIRDRLRDGLAVVANLDYAQLPDWLRVQGGAFGHSVCLYGVDDELVGFFDPLWPEGARGAWVTWDEIRGALWGDGEHSGTTTRWGEDPDPPPGPDPDPPPAPAEEHTVDELEQLQRDAYATAVVDRDRAWRGTLEVLQPRSPAGWGQVDGVVDGAAWSWFARWGPEPPASTWSGPYATWDALTWR